MWLYIPVFCCVLLVHAREQKIRSVELILCQSPCQCLAVCQSRRWTPNGQRHSWRAWRVVERWTLHMYNVCVCMCIVDSIEASCLVGAVSEDPLHYYSTRMK